MPSHHSKQENTSASSGNLSHPVIKQLQELNDQLVDSVVSATFTVPSFTRPALAVVIPIEDILLKMEKEAASGSMQEIDEIRGKMPKLSELVHVLIGEFESIAKARSRDEADKIWSYLDDAAGKIADWYYGDVITE